MSASRKEADSRVPEAPGAGAPGATGRRLLNEAQEAEIRELREEQFETRRTTVPELEEILYEPLPVLDRGFVRVIDYMGDDGAIVQAARVSYGKGTRKLRGDAGLINYLLRHRHTTPFEMCEIKYHVKLPIFVARQWIRHRTANVNEYSARYSILDKEFYIPAPDSLAAQSELNRQGRGDVLEGEEAARVFQILQEDSERCYEHYEEMLNAREDGSVIDESKTGLARELARMNLPLNIYTQWYWKCDLHNLMHFLSLRADPHAQYEIRAYAEVMLETVRRWVPMTYGAFANHMMEGVKLSGGALAVVKRLLAGERVAQEESGLSKREWAELMIVLDRQP
ncbi:MAG: FAD-dependent thymidylate synthase [Kiloniellales bacterium]